MEAQDGLRGMATRVEKMKVDLSMVIGGEGCIGGEGLVVEFEVATSVWMAVRWVTVRTGQRRLWETT